jgi:tight adherence protein B
MSLLLVMVSVFVLGTGAVVGLYFAVARLPEVMARRRVQSRLEEVNRGFDVTDGETPASLIKTRSEGPLPLLDRLASGTARGSALGTWIEQSGVRVSFSAVLLLSVGAGVAAAFAGAIATRHPVGWPVGGLLGMAVPFLVLHLKRKRRFSTFEEHFPEALDLIARALKAGHAFNTGLKMVADELEEPVGPEFRKTFDEQNFGLPVKEALQNLTARMPLLDVRFFATAVMIQRDTGGNLSEILENLAHVVRERFKILRQVRVYTAHGRLTGYVLLALPAVLAVALSFINPDHMNLLFRERMGQTLLLVAAGMQFVGYLWIKQVIKIEV